ncbi:cation:proton antiporter [Larkinella insperata]|uniref:Cation:proton antiporter n=1 Tax=Larkinella insperata TaxID=332158 RepID=A0ABW3QKV2_9BACT
MDLLTTITLLIIVSAGFAYLNERVFKLPGTIGVMTIAVMVSLIIVILGNFSDRKSSLFTDLAHNIDFSSVLLDIMLGFLLFAMALHFDYKKLKELRRPVIVFSTVSVLISAGVFGVLFWGMTQLLHVSLPLLYCFLFGALISPTDPIAVASILKKSKIPSRLETIISGESMFNDAVGLILFVTLQGIVEQTEEGFSWERTILLFSQEVIGGIIIGLVMGYVGFRLIRSTRANQTVFLISVALVLGISVVARSFHASVPLSVVVAGLLIGNLHVKPGRSTPHFLSQIWELLDEVLNTLLFVMMGLQLILLPFLSKYWVLEIFSIGLILIARLISISFPAWAILRRLNVSNLFILTWAGLRGGISIAMALSLPPSTYREVILSCCYIIVVFSVIFQGLTLKRLVDNLAPAAGSD